MDATFAGTVKLARLPFVDYDYDQGGAYWGGGSGTAAMWAASWDDDAEGVVAYHYFRAGSFKAAYAYVTEAMPNATCTQAVNVVNRQLVRQS
jgi:hypothetical protein